jgi:hypothetical protein
MKLQTLIPTGIGFIPKGLAYLSSGDFRLKKSKMTHKIAPYSWLDDKYWLEFYYHRTFGYRLNLRNPRTFNEKIQWMKLYDRNPLYTRLADKYLVRDYVRDRIGAEHLVELLCACDATDEINWDSLPPRFAMKVNHGAGWVILCNDKEKVDCSDAEAKLNEWLGSNFYRGFREWQYKDIPRKILVERMIDGDPELGLLEYKFFCFSGTPRVIQTNVVTNEEEGDRRKRISLLYLDTDWTPFDASLELYPRAEKTIPRPPNLERMLDMASVLSRGLPFCRVDLYSVAGRILFSEMTLSPCAGLLRLSPWGFDRLLGDYFELPERKQRRPLAVSSL